MSYNNIFSILIFLLLIFIVLTDESKSNNVIIIVLIGILITSLLNSNSKLLGGANPNTIIQHPITVKEYGSQYKYQPDSIGVCVGNNNYINSLYDLVRKMRKIIN